MFENWFEIYFIVGLVWWFLEAVFMTVKESKVKSKFDTKNMAAIMVVSFGLAVIWPFVLIFVLMTFAVSLTTGAINRLSKNKPS